MMKQAGENGGSPCWAGPPPAAAAAAADDDADDDGSQNHGHSDDQGFKVH